MHPHEHACGADEQRVWDALRSVTDPEIGMSIVDVGLVYSVRIEAGSVQVRMTMTSPACPMGEAIVEDARQAILAACPEIEHLELELVWDPPWEPSMMSLEARRSLGWHE